MGGCYLFGVDADLFSGLAAVRLHQVIALIKLEMMAILVSPPKMRAVINHTYTQSASAELY